MSRLDWAAGFLEGEGSFYSNRRNQRGGYYDPTVTAAQVSPECLHKLQAAFGGSVNGHKRPEPNRRTLYQWRLTGKRAILLMRELYPLMSEHRREQIDRVLENARADSRYIELF